MMYTKFLLALITIACIVYFILGNRNPTIGSTELAIRETAVIHDLKIHPQLFYDKDLFFAGIAKSKNASAQFSEKIFGGIIPHHLFPSFILTDFFNRLSKQNPSTIILIGPNHYEAGNHKVISSLYGWETPFGIVEPNEKIIQSLIENNVAFIDEINIPNDHSVAGIMPYIKYHLKDTRVVPLLLSGFMNENEIQALSRQLKKHVTDDTVLVAAVDFSHYLTNKEAQEKDELTLELMEKFEYSQILTLNNDYLDSPPSIVALLITMKSLNKTDLELLYNTNSGQILRNDSVETTSYFSVGFY